MKRTKNMVYKPSADAKEVYICLVNEGDLYRHSTLPIINNLKKKAAKGVYNPERAIDIYYRLVNEYLTRFYYKNFCSAGFVFPVEVRYTVAVDLERRYYEHVFEDVNQ